MTTDRWQYSKVILILILVLLHIVLIISGNGSYGGADNITHFRIARYAFDYPHLFFDHWGKPVFTALVAPFTLVGYKAAQIFNVVTGALTIWLSYKILQENQIRTNPVLLFLIGFSPMYFLLMQSVLTEVLMSFFLVLAIWLTQKSKLWLAAIVLSFLPFIRTESILVWPVFVLFFLYRRNYLAVALLSAGSLFYSITGSFFTGDILWIINQMPYSVNNNLYGSGELLHFVKHTNEIIGFPFAIFLVIGIAVWAFKVFRKIDFTDDNFWLFVIVTGSWTVYFLAHSYVWWKGISSLGLIRVMAGIVPLVAITAALGVN
jgi:hypothetical protein